MDAFSWPVEKLYELLHHLCERARLHPGAELAAPEIAPATFTDSLALAASQLGVEAHAVTIPLERLEPDLPSIAPAVVRIDRGGERLIAIVRGDRRRLAVVGRGGQVFEIDRAELRTADHRVSEPPRSTSPSRLLELAGEGTHERDVAHAWRIRPSAGAPLWRQVRGAGLHRTAALLGGMHLARLFLLALSWWVLGRGALDGTLDTPLLLGWALVLTTFVAVTATTEWLQENLLLAINIRYRRKTMHGATSVSPRVSRSIGSGQLLGRIFETEALDTLAVNAGLTGITAAIDVVFSLALFLVIPGARLLGLVFAAWLLLIAIRGVWLYGVQRSWTLQRIAMSEEVVEGLLGRRTRLAQLGRRRSHQIEDRTLERYLAASGSVDRAETSFEAIAGRGWLLAGLLALAALAGSGSISTGSTAAAVGAVLLGFQALTRAAGSVHLAAALVISWHQARVIYRASEEPDLVGVPDVVEAERFARGDRAGPLVQARKLGHRPSPDREPALDRVSLSVGASERVLLTGPSGGGKSTLARLLCGLEQPATGTVSLRGLDRGALGGEEWARRIAYVPPFNDNHVFSASLLYNLLPGRWPPTAGDVAEAERVCAELGLGPLLERMPGRLHQTVGETGWRLSHGERTRLYLARAILQRPELVILDESFGALDAATMVETMDCVLRRSPALILINHV